MCRWRSAAARLRCEMEKLPEEGHGRFAGDDRGQKIAATFWGKAWCDNLESYRDYENRLPRGRTYVRNGSVVDLQIGAERGRRRWSADRRSTRSGSASRRWSKAQWKSICADCSGGIDSLVELLQGRLSKGVMERICRQGTGLFPRPSEIRFSCSCPDCASMCKHVAAALYGVGCAAGCETGTAVPVACGRARRIWLPISARRCRCRSRRPAAGKVLETDDMAALFGLDMGGEEAPEAGGGDAVSPPPSITRRPLPQGSGSDGAAGKVPARKTVRTAKTSPKPVGRPSKTAAVRTLANPAGRPRL